MVKTSAFQDSNESKGAEYLGNALKGGIQEFKSRGGRLALSDMKVPAGA